MAKFDIIAATGCPTGIAHTFMAKEALEKAAAERGLTIKVETHGQVGVENELTKSEIAGAKAVVVAADKDVQAERFAGKPMVSVGVSKALSVEAAGKLIDRALAAKGDDTVAAAADVEDEVEEKESIGHVIYKHLMNGVSHMLVFVVAGGVLTAVSFLWGITSFDSTAADYNTFAAMLKIIGGIAMNLMVPVLSAYIAESIGKRPALVPGFVAGMIAIQGLPVNAETGMIDAGGAGVGFGFLGGIVGGFLAGYVILLLEKVFAGLPSMVDDLLEEPSVTFLRRAQQRTLGAISLPKVRDSYIQTVKDAGLYVDAETADLAARKSMGHPYMVQLVGYYMWRSAVRRGSQVIERHDVEAGHADAVSEFYEAVDAPLYYGLRSPQRLFIEAMAVDEGKPTRMADIIERCDRTQSWASKYRASLIRERVIEAAGYGLVRFTVPMLGEYIRDRILWHE